VATGGNVAGALAVVGAIGLAAGWAMGQSGISEAKAGWAGWHAEALRAESEADAGATELAECQFELAAAGSRADQRARQLPYQIPAAILP
jgi:hypothetical protein